MKRITPAINTKKNAEKDALEPLFAVRSHNAVSHSAGIKISNLGARVTYGDNHFIQ